MKSIIRLLRSALIWWYIAFALRCSQNIAGGSTDTGNAVVTGYIYNSNGSPAAYCPVRLYSINYNPMPMQSGDSMFVDSTSTDGAGKYVFKDIKQGYYNVITENNSGMSLCDSLYLKANTTTTAPADTVRSDATIHGIVRLMPSNGDPRKVFIAALGTSRWTALKDSTGIFVLGPFAEGKYTLRFQDTSSQYQPLDLMIPLRSGTDTILKDTVLLNLKGATILQYGITWVFDKKCVSGTFANGDFWVLGPVKILRIMPDFDGQNHGWEVNPVVKGTQGFDKDAGNFDASLVPVLPYNARPGESIVKTISSLNSSRCIQTAAVLTVVSAIPPDSGTTVFRPPYIGADKPLYSINSMQTGLLPSLDTVSNSPSTKWVEEQFQRVQLDHKEGAVGKNLHPIENIPDYGTQICRRNSEGALCLMLNIPVAEKRRALIHYLQYGIDLFHMVLLGQTWPAGAGQTPGQKLPLVFTAVVLNNQVMKDTIMRATFFHENKCLLKGSNTFVTLFGESGASEETYWKWLALGDPVANAQLYADPYGYVDGGTPDTQDYVPQMGEISQPWKGEALVAYLFPDLQKVWSQWDLFINYVHRWVYNGFFTQPDPCAPAEKGNWDNYGITYGPDPNNPGHCICDTNPANGTGRFPGIHGKAKDAGFFNSEFVNALWKKYYPGEER